MSLIYSGFVILSVWNHSMDGAKCSKYIFYGWQCIGKVGTWQAYSTSMLGICTIGSAKRHHRNNGW